MTDTTPNAEQAVAAAESAELGRYRQLPLVGNLWLALGAVLSVVASIYVIFGLGNQLGLYVPLETEYFYFMIAVLLPLPFLIYPSAPAAAGTARIIDLLLPSLAFAVPGFLALQMSGLYAPLGLGLAGDLIIFALTVVVFALPYLLRGPDRATIPLYDWLLALAALAIAGYFALQGSEILDIGWEYDAPTHAKYLAFALWAIVLEATRRAGGNAIFIVCLIVSIYPIYANFAPAILAGAPIPPATTIGFHMFGTESMLGIPMNAFANLVVGFLVFGVALQYTGGGAFFLNLAFALLGRHRGGPAKVAIFGSGLMGSMSGSVITNVLTTGVMTIPAMKRVGFRPAYAAGVEACASTGGVLDAPGDGRDRLRDGDVSRDVVRRNHHGRGLPLVPLLSRPFPPDRRLRRPPRPQGPAGGRTPPDEPGPA